MHRTAGQTVRIPVNRPGNYGKESGGGKNTSAPTESGPSIDPLTGFPQHVVEVMQQEARPALLTFQSTHAVMRAPHVQLKWKAPSRLAAQSCASLLQARVPRVFVTLHRTLCCGAG